MKFCFAVLAIVSLTFATASDPARMLRTPAARDPQNTGSATQDAQRSVWDGVYTEEQAERGHGFYHQQCESCHGEALLGNDEAPPLVGAQFLGNWSGLTAGDLFERIRLSMPQNNPGHLSRQTNADILAYIFAANHFPAGKAELARESEILKQIRIESAKSEKQDQK